jgi:hypothetical protein
VDAPLRSERRNPPRKAKRRPRIDIEILYVKRGPRPRFQFEAKRLGLENHVGDYLGKEGLGCFETGQYARDSDDAGMLGYVQKDTCDGWAGKIERSLHKDRVKHHLELFCLSRSFHLSLLSLD